MCDSVWSSPRVRQIHGNGGIWWGGLVFFGSGKGGTHERRKRGLLVLELGEVDYEFLRLMRLSMVRLI